MGTNKPPLFKVGDEAVVVDPYGTTHTVYDVKVAKVGRAWVTLANGARFQKRELEPLREEGDYSAWLWTPAGYAAFLEAQELRAALLRALTQRNPGTLDQLRAAAKALGIEVEP